MSSETKPIQCIGIILDGNRRWAKEHNLPTLEGHRRGFENLKNATRWVRDRGIQHLVVYAFSTENFNRSSDEVSYLMDMIREAAREHVGELVQEGVRLHFIGDRSKLASDIQGMLAQVEVQSAANSKLDLWVGLAYGGQAEIASAARAASEKGEINEETIKNNLWSAGMPDPDLIIRTGGAQRLSNFLLWQAAYSEFFFHNAYWPDFGESDLDAVLSQYEARTRNFGI